jgi:arylsulfatase A-like enzyme
MLLEALPLFSVHVQPIIDRFYDNSLDNIGNKTSFKCEYLIHAKLAILMRNEGYGPRWGQAATAPSRMYKSHISEGGIKCPAIVHYPKVLQQPSPECCSDAMVTVKDLMPTVLELAGISHPGTSFRGRPVFPCTGASWVSHLQGKTNRVHSEDTPLGFELFAQRALILGDFKIVFVPKPVGPGHWQLYNLKNDPGEVHDLSLTADGGNKEKLQNMVRLWADYVSEFGVVDSTSLGDWEEYSEKVGFKDNTENSNL